MEFGAKRLKDKKDQSQSVPIIRIIKVYRDYVKIIMILKFYIPDLINIYPIYRNPNILVCGHMQQLAFV